MRTRTAAWIPAIPSTPSRPLSPSIEVPSHSKAPLTHRSDSFRYAHGSVRVALYSPGMVGLGHLRRNLLVARALVSSNIAKTVLLLAEAEVHAFAMPQGVDCVSLPAFGNVASGRTRYLGLSFERVITLRTQILRAALESFDPDVLVVDQMPRGTAGELGETLDGLGSHTRCVLGLRDVPHDAQAAWHDWDRSRTEQAIRDHYDAIWIYGDPSVYDVVSEHGFPQDITAKVRYTGYLDHQARFQSEGPSSRESLPDLEIPRGRLALCLPGRGQDGGPLAEAFAQSRLPEGTFGVIVTGRAMPAKSVERVRQMASRSSQIRVLDSLREPSLLLSRADSVITAGGYHTTWEALSFGKRALLVPSLEPSEQWIRAKRLEALGLVEVLSPESATPASLTEWLARARETREGDVRTPAKRVAFDGLDRLPALLDDVLWQEKPPHGGRSS